MEPQKPPKSQNNLETEQKQEVSYSNFKLYYKHTEIKTEWYWDKIHTQRSMEHNRKPRKKHTYLWSINLWQRRQECISVLLWKLDSYLQKEWNWTNLIPYAEINSRLIKHSFHPRTGIVLWAEHKLCKKFWLEGKTDGWTVGWMEGWERKAVDSRATALLNFLTF